MIMIKYEMLVRSSDSGCDSDVAKSWVVHMHLWHFQNPDSFKPEGRARIKIWNQNQPVLWKTKQTCSLTHNTITQKCWEKKGCQWVWCVQQTAEKDVWKPINKHILTKLFCSLTTNFLVTSLYSLNWYIIPLFESAKVCQGLQQAGHYCKITPWQSDTGQFHNNDPLPVYYPVYYTATY